MIPFGHRISCELSTEVPGVSLRMRARVRTRREPKSSLSRTSARAAAMEAVGDFAAKQVADRRPEERDLAAHRIRTHFADWQPVNGHAGLHVRAKIRLGLEGADAERATAFDDARRARHLEQTVVQDRVEYLRKICADPVQARLSWLAEHPDGSHAVTDWSGFEAVVLPLVELLGGQEDPALRAAQVITGAVRRLHAAPEEQKLFLVMAKAILEEMRWHELAEQVEPSNPV